MRRIITAAAILLASMVGQVFAANVPEPLQPWQDWVLRGQEFRRCPFVSTLGSANESAYRCAWPGALVLDLGASGGEFRQRWQVHADAWVVLPGSTEYWPRDLKLDGKAAAVVQREGRPQLYLAAGTHEITGRFAWTDRPEALPIARQTALLQLTLDGRAVPQPERTNGDVWLGQRRSAVERDRLEVAVYRLLRDDIPARISTRLQLFVSGAGREVLLGPVLPAGFVPMALEGDLPARLEPDGRLRVQLRPGSFELTLEARGAAVAGNITRPAAAEPWPADEVWSFESVDNLRVAAVEGAESIDPAQASVPDEWHEYPAFRLNAGGALNVVERSRALVNPDDNQLQLARNLWLDFDHHGFTFTDQITGQLNRDWRLDLAKPYSLESARVNGDNLLVTDSAEGASGVELRDRQLELATIGRVEDPRASLPATGWSTRFDNVQGWLHLPPGHRLLGALGADSATGSWMSRWGLWDLFGVLVVVVLTHWVAGWFAASVAAVALLLVYQELPAMVWLWANLLAAIALVRGVPEGKLRRHALRYRIASFLVLALALLPLLLGQLRLAIYPQLATSDGRGMPMNIAAHPVLLDEAARDEMAAMAPPPEVKLDMPAPVTQPESQQLEEVQVTGSRIQSVTNRYADGTLLQAGSGVPNWQYNSYMFSWSGPVEPSQQLRFIFIGPVLLGLWRILGILASLLFALLLLRNAFGFPLQLPGVPAAWLRSRATMALLLTGLLFALPAPRADAQAMPTPEMLNELKTRLTQPAACGNSCAEIIAAEVRAEGGRLEVTLSVSALANLAVAMPHAGDRWQLDSVQVDGRAAPFALREADDSAWLPLSPGAHRVQLAGRLANAETVQLNFPQTPRAITVSASGWDASGVSNGRLLAGSVELIRRRAAGSAAAQLAPSEFAPFVQVRREFQLDLDWYVATSVERLAPRAAPLQVEVPLVPGESVLSDDVEVQGGNRVLVGLARGESSREWRSRLARSETLAITLPADAARTEQWVFLASPEWHLEFAGLPASLPEEQGARWAWHFIPRAGETLNVTITRPAATPGRTLALDSVAHESTFGKRAVNGKLTLHYRSTQGGRHTLKLPEALRVTQVTVDGDSIPVRPDKGELPLSLLVGEHTVEIQWTAPRGAGLLTKPDRIEIGAPASNLTTTIRLPEDRWALFTHGQGVGTVVLYWGEVAAFTLLAWLLALRRGSPLPFRDWLLLGLGLSTLSWTVFVIVALWLLVMRWRMDWQHADTRRWPFNLVQLSLAAITVIAVTSLVFSGVRYGLLARPDMALAGPMDYPYGFQWFLDRTESSLPQPSVLSVPMWVYRLLMFAWAAWAAMALRRWVVASWHAWTAGGFWRAKPPKVAVSAGPSTAA